MNQGVTRNIFPLGLLRVHAIREAQKLWSFTVCSIFLLLAPCQWGFMPYTSYTGAFQLNLAPCIAGTLNTLIRLIIAQSFNLFI